MLRQFLSRLRNASRKIKNRTTARAAFRKRLFVESLEERRLMAVFNWDGVRDTDGAESKHQLE